MKKLYYNYNTMNTIIRKDKPLYIQIIELIKKKFIKGEYMSGDKLPPVREMAKKLRINPNTVAKAYQILEKEGLVKTKIGGGTFLTENKTLLRKEKERIIKRSIKEIAKLIKDYGISKKELYKQLEDIWE